MSESGNARHIQQLLIEQHPLSQLALVRSELSSISLNETNGVPDFSMIARRSDGSADYFNPDVFASAEGASCLVITTPARRNIAPATRGVER